MGPNEWKNQEALLLPEEHEKNDEKRNGDFNKDGLKVDLEDVLSESVGKWGWFQMWTQGARK